MCCIFMLDNTVLGNSYSVHLFPVGAGCVILMIEFEFARARVTYLGRVVDQGEVRSV